MLDHADVKHKIDQSTWSTGRVQAESLPVAPRIVLILLVQRLSFISSDPMFDPLQAGHSKLATQSCNNICMRVVGSSGGWTRQSPSAIMGMIDHRFQCTVILACLDSLPASMSDPLAASVCENVHDDVVGVCGQDPEPPGHTVLTACTPPEMISPVCKCIFARLHCPQITQPAAVGVSLVVSA